MIEGNLFALALQLRDFILMVFGLVSCFSLPCSNISAPIWKTRCSSGCSIMVNSRSSDALALGKVESVTTVDTDLFYKNGPRSSGAGHYDAMPFCYQVIFSGHSSYDRSW